MLPSPDGPEPSRKVTLPNREAMMYYAIVREGSTELIKSGIAPSKGYLVFTNKAKADESCRRMNGSLDPPGSPKPTPPYVVIERVDPPPLRTS